MCSSFGSSVRYGSVFGAPRGYLEIARDAATQAVVEPAPVQGSRKDSGHCTPPRGPDPWGGKARLLALDMFILPVDGHTPAAAKELALPTSRAERGRAAEDGFE